MCACRVLLTAASLLRNKITATGFIRLVVAFKACTNLTSITFG
jgi:hypothetical protein